jgi:lysophospholipase L1-like esterase
LKKLRDRLSLGLRALGASGCIGLLILLVWQIFMRPELGFAKSELVLFVSLLFLLVLLFLPGTFFGRLRSKLAALVFGSLLAVGILEGYIRLFDPFPILLRGGRIDLPVHAKKEFALGSVPGLDTKVSVTFNSIGFRGPEPPVDWDSAITMICVGGSTTQCLYLSDGTTWPDCLAAKFEAKQANVWINNAGIDGHSSFGHLELLDQFLVALRPKVLLFLVGLNDVDREDLSQYDASTLRSLKRDEDSIARTVQRMMLRNSDAFALLDNFRLQWSARRKGLTHGEPIGHQPISASIESRPLTDESRTQWLAQRNPICLEGYQRRLEAIVKRCAAVGIECILVTQPVLYGVGRDDITGVDLERVSVGEVDGWTHWRLLQQYNQVTKQVGQDNNVSVIDLANELPKSSRYFYDLTHYNQEGAQAVAEIVYQGIGLWQ